MIFSYSTLFKVSPPPAGGSQEGHDIKCAKLLTSTVSQKYQIARYQIPDTRCRKGYKCPQQGRPCEVVVYMSIMSPIRTSCLCKGRPRAGMSSTGMSSSGHNVPANNVLGGDVISLSRQYILDYYVLDGDVPNEDIMSTQGRSGEDVLGGFILSPRRGLGCSCTDVLIEDICVHFYFCPFIQGNILHPMQIQGVLIASRTSSSLEEQSLLNHTMLYNVFEKYMVKLFCITTLVNRTVKKSYITS